MCLRKLHDRSEAAELSAGLSAYVRIAGLGEIKFSKGCPGTKQTILWALKRRGARRFGQRIGIEGDRTIGVRIVEGDPRGLKDIPICMQILHILRENVRISLAGVEYDGLTRRQGQDLEGLQLAGLQVRWVFGYKAIDETVGLPRIDVDGPK